MKIDRNLNKADVVIFLVALALLILYFSIPNSSFWAPVIYGRF